MRNEEIIKSELKHCHCEAMLCNNIKRFIEVRNEIQNIKANLNQKKIELNELIKDFNQRLESFEYEKKDLIQLTSEGCRCAIVGRVKCNHKDDEWKKLVKTQFEEVRIK